MRPQYHHRSYFHQGMLTSGQELLAYYALHAAYPLLHPLISITTTEAAVYLGICWSSSSAWLSVKPSPANFVWISERPNQTCKDNDDDHNLPQYYTDHWDHPEHEDEADDDGGEEDDKEENSHVVTNVALEAHLSEDDDAADY